VVQNTITPLCRGYCEDLTFGVQTDRIHNHVEDNFQTSTKSDTKLSGQQKAVNRARWFHTLKEAIDLFGEKKTAGYGSPHYHVAVGRRQTVRRVHLSVKKFAWSLTRRWADQSNAGTQ
jgi:hypothetical protein